MGARCFAYGRLCPNRWRFARFQEAAVGSIRILRARVATNQHYRRWQARRAEQQVGKSQGNDALVIRCRLLKVALDVTINLETREPGRKKMDLITENLLQNTTQDLFELLERVQSSRLDDQRCVLPSYFSQVRNKVRTRYEHERRYPIAWMNSNYLYN